MSGYRDTSGYEPYGQPAYGRPLKPYNMVQWTGVALVVVGLAIDAIYFAERLGWLPVKLGTPTLALVPLIVGVALINSRRDPAHDLAPDLAPARRRWLIIIVAVCAAILGLAAAIQFSGA